MRRSREKGATRRMQRARGKGNRNNRGNYLRAPRRRNRRKRDRRKGVGGGGEGEAARLFPRDFLIIYRARVFLSFVAREDSDAISRITAGRYHRDCGRLQGGIQGSSGKSCRLGRMSLSVWISLQ